MLRRVETDFAPGGVVLFELPTSAAGERLLQHLG
jgi:hypothetical protein